MSNPEHVFDDRTPGVEEHEPTASYLIYTVGLGLAIVRSILEKNQGSLGVTSQPGMGSSFVVRLTASPEG